MLNASTEVEVVRLASASSAGARGGDVILNATGYIIAAHKIQVASKVLGRVAWIGVDKGDKVREGQVIVVSKMRSTRRNSSKREAGSRLWRPG